jgi:hypothetical protein
VVWALVELGALYAENNQSGVAAKMYHAALGRPTHEFSKEMILQRIEDLSEPFCEPYCRDRDVKSTC